MLVNSAVIAFVGSADLDRSRRFYGSTLGLAMIEQNDFACVFDAHGTMLRVTAVPDVAPVGYTVLGWRVEDIATTVAELSGGGVEFNRYPGLTQDDAGVWTTPGGDYVAWFRDPDGNTPSLTQFTT